MRASIAALLFWSLSPLAACGKECPAAGDTSIIAHEGTPVGEEMVVDGTTFYVSKPKCKQPKAAVLYLTDVFGIQLAQNKLLADSFARAGYLVLAPDFFNGTPAPSDIDGSSTFNTTAFLALHGPEVTDPIIAKAINTLRSPTGPFRVTRVGATGYCYGGRYAFRFANPDKGVDVAFAAHPSLLGDDEILAASGPSAIAAAEMDALMPAARRHDIEALLGQRKKPWQMAVYSGTQHGFGVRANVSDAQQRVGKEGAFFQAVRWFEDWL